MQLKKYEAPTIKEALKKIKTELGDNAVIFSSKTLTPKNSQCKKYVEVTAAVERNRDGLLRKSFEKSANNSGLLDNKLYNNDQIGRTHSFIANNLNDPCNYNKNEKKLFSSIFSSCLNNLLLSGFNRDIACLLIGETNAEYNMDSNTSSFDNILLKKISCHIPVTGPISLNPEKRKIVALVGPTGVGKTTTLAKIAARCSIIQGIKTKILTMDTYRIAAAEQLKIYGKIMDIPVNVVLNHSELEKEIRLKDNANLILIDTAGRNYRDNEQINEINLWIQKYEEIEPYLLLSSTTSEDVLMATLKCFGKCRVASIVITKIDETLSFGHLFNALISFKKPVSYITTGQRVPEDIEPASSKSLSEIFLNGFNN